MDIECLLIVFQSGDILTHMNGEDVMTLAHAQIARRLANANTTLTISVQVSM
jgi:hypothetical protein